MSNYRFTKISDCREVRKTCMLAHIVAQSRTESFSDLTLENNLKHNLASREVGIGLARTTKQ